MTFHDEMFKRFKAQVTAAERVGTPVEVSALEVEHTPIAPNDVIIITVKTSDDEGHVFSASAMNQLMTMGYALAQQLEQLTGAKAIVKPAHYAINILSPEDDDAEESDNDA